MRYLILVLLMILAYSPVKNNKMVFKWTMALYALFLSIRCGLGLDYFSYGYLYYTQPTLGELIAGVETYHTQSLDPGYTYLVGILRVLNTSYEVFVAGLSIISIILLYRFIVKYSKNYMLSLFVLYACYGIVILESTVRQSIAMMLLVTLALPFIEKKAYIKAGIIMVIAYFMHATSFLFSAVLIVFYVDWSYRIVVKYWAKLMVIAIPVIFLINVIGLSNIILRLPLPTMLMEKAILYVADGGGYSVVAATYRIIMFCVIMVALYACDIEERVRRMLYILASGYVIYFFFAQMSLLSRLTMYFEILEIVVVPALLYGAWRYRFLTSSTKNTLVAFCTVGYMVILALLFNNDMTYIAQTSGFDTNYVPYISLFQKADLDDYFDREEDPIYSAYALLFDIPVKIE
ncbi:MAG: EpsG family protein [Eubacteriales bacterium]